MEGISGGTVKGRKRVGTLGRKIPRIFSVLFFSPPQKYYAPIFHHTPKYESLFRQLTGAHYRAPAVDK